jgi:outer membrane protein assembly factor BamE (lipoprotein component of BamABCDE complex)
MTMNERSCSALPKLVGACAILFVAAGCAMTAGEHRAAVRDDAAERLSVGKVQREIRVGMSGAEVLQVLGSPNIVSTDDQRREVWAYDRIATERVYSTSYGGIAALILGGALAGDGLLGAAAGPYYGGSAGATSTHQRTFTVVIKFDDGKRVRDFAYHATSF